MGRTNVILDNLLAEGKVKPMIVVMESFAVGSRCRCLPPPLRLAREPAQAQHPEADFADFQQEAAFTDS